MKMILASLLTLIMLVSLFGCSNTAQTETPPVTTSTTTGTPTTTTPTVKPVSFETVKSNQSRIISPYVTDTQLTTLVQGNGEFAFDLYHALRQKETGNIFYSPYSISSALAMTYAGARGETEKQMAETLCFTLPQEELHPAFNSVALALESRGQETENQDKMGFILKNVNAIWGQRGEKFLPDFLDVLAENYGAGMKTLDFARDPEKSRLTINDWVSEQTANKIRELLPEGSINASVFLVLTNAIYFKANWFFQFDEKNTSDGQFNLLNGQVTVPMMHQTEYFDYAEGDGYQAVELLYRNRKLSMVVLLPEQGQFEKFENSLQYSQLEEILNNLESRQVILSMPKFKFASKSILKQTLSKMGMPIAFTGGADFSGIVEGGGSISEVYHDAFIAVDELGTEAAAATAVAIAGVMPGGPVEFTMERPFLFLIRDIDTNTVLFMGRVVNPLD
ncbi:MAG: serpin family protein [Dehalococcoidales bacterium]|nr:serpin family protein [Dehalococcoidales bacterium]